MYSNAAHALTAILTYLNKELHLNLCYKKQPSIESIILLSACINFRASWSHVFEQTDSTILNPEGTLDHNADLFQPIPPALAFLTHPFSVFMLHPHLLFSILYILFDQFSRGRLGIRASFILQWQAVARFRGRYDLYTTCANVPRMPENRKANLNPRLHFDFSGDVLRMFLDVEEKEGAKVKS